jgi:hypothetical protein
MTKDNEQYAYLTITGDFDPELITVRLGLKPTECWRKGDRYERTTHERQFSRWSLESRLNRSASLESHVRDVIEQAASRAEIVREIGTQYDCWVQLVGLFHNNYPGFGMDREIISGLAKLNVGIDCDFYYLYSHEREDSA